VVAEEHAEADARRLVTALSGRFPGPPAGLGYRLGRVPSREKASMMTTQTQPLPRRPQSHRTRESHAVRYILLGIFVVFLALFIAAGITGTGHAARSAPVPSPQAVSYGCNLDWHQGAWGSHLNVAVNPRAGATR